MTPEDMVRVRGAAVECLYAELMAILNISEIEVGGKKYIRFKSDIVPELKRKVTEFRNIAKTGK